MIYVLVMMSPFFLHVGGDVVERLVEDHQILVMQEREKKGVKIAFSALQSKDDVRSLFFALEDVMRSLGVDEEGHQVTPRRNKRSKGKKPPSKIEEDEEDEEEASMNKRRSTRLKKSKK